MLVRAHELGCEVLPDYFSKFSKQEFTKAQLFACLVLREHQKKSYRGIEALLADSPAWLAEIGMQTVPDHNTLWRAFKQLIKPSLANSVMDLMAQMAQKQGQLRADKSKPLSVDSSLFESRHVSRHFEARRQHVAKKKSRPR
jgi:hypothetical protein